MGRIFRVATHTKADKTPRSIVTTPPSIRARTPYLGTMATQLSDITLSPAAAARVRWIANRKGEAEAALRLAVDGGGCSGFTYRFGLAEGIDAEDIVTETDGVKLVVDPVSIDLVRGLYRRFCRFARRVVVQGRKSQRGLGLRLRVELLDLTPFVATPLLP